MHKAQPTIQLETTSRQPPSACHTAVFQVQEVVSDFNRRGGAGI